jgi:beta-galactosidase/beta-glucuronidase
MKDAARAIDDTRPFHYEGDHNPAISDVVSRMYATAEQMAALGRHEGLRPSPAALLTDRFLTDDKLVTPQMQAGRPVLLCEYAHAMENSLGNFAEYIDVFYSYPNHGWRVHLGLHRPEHPAHDADGRSVAVRRGLRRLAQPSVLLRQRHPGR